MRTRVGHWLAVVALAAFSCAVAGELPGSDIRSLFRQGDAGAIQAWFDAHDGPTGAEALRLLATAAAEGDQALAGRLIQLGVPLNAALREGEGAGESALMAAVSAGRGDMVAFLLQKGANPNFVGHSFNGISHIQHIAIIGAVSDGNLAITRQLLAAGADPNVLNAYPVEVANATGNIEMYKLLVAHGGRLPPARPKPEANGPARAIPLPGVAQLIARDISGVPEQPSAARSTCRLAIIADDPNVAAADRLAALLSHDNSIELVERQDINRILAERNLTRAFAADAANAGVVGADVQADALLLIRTVTVGSEHVVETRFVRVNPGIVLDTRYHAAPLDLGWADTTRARITALITKAVQPDAIALSLLDVRPTVHSALATDVAMVATALLRDRLVRDPRFIVLERSEIEKAALEQRPEHSFWAGSYVVDPAIDVALDHTGDFMLTVRLEPLAGGRDATTVRAKGNRDQPVAAIEELCAAIRATLGETASVRPPDATREAESYLAEARWALAAEMPERAHACAEVAWGLGRRSLETARLRWRSAFAAMREACLRPEGPDTDAASTWLDLATHGIGVWRDAFEGELVAGKPDELGACLNESPNITEDFLLANVALSSAVDQIAHADALAALRSSYWAAMRAAGERARQLPPSTNVANTIAIAEAKSIRVALRDPAELIAGLRALYLEHFPRDDNATRAAMRTEFQWNQISVLTPMSRTGRRDAKRAYLPPDIELRQHFITELQATEQPDDAFLAALVGLRPYANRLSDRENSALIDTLWGLRDILANDRQAFVTYIERFSLISQDIVIGGRPARTFPAHLNGAGNPAVDVNIAEFQRRLYLYLLDHATAENPEFARLLMPSRYTAAQRAEIAAAYERYALKTGARAPSPIAMRSQPAITPLPRPSSGQMPANRAAMTQPLLVGHLWLNPNLPEQLHLLVHTETFQWVEDRLWFYGEAIDRDHEPATLYRSVFALDCRTGATEPFELPARPLAEGSGSAAVLAISPRHIVLALEGRFLAVYDRVRRSWEIFDDIKPTHSSGPVIVDDTAYVIAENATAVVRLNLTSRRSENLVSTRRKPAETPLDATPLWLSGLWQDDQGEIVVAGETEPLSASQSRVTAAAWNTAEKSWRTLQTLEPRASSLLASVCRPGLPSAGYLSGSNSDFHAVGGTREQRAGGSLTLHLHEAGASRDIPIDFKIVSAVEPPVDGYGNRGLLSVGPCLATPEGYVFPFFAGGPGFWFLPRAELEAYQSRDVAVVGKAQ